ncbi:hypothetical protein BH11BAC5_BH11BAC5_41420 [soil metagenome]
MKHTKTIALISLSGCLLFFVIVCSLHFLRPDKNMLSCFVSEYAVGNYSWLMKVAGYSLTIASALLLTGLSMNIKASKKSIASLGIFCIGFLLLTIFPTDVPVVPPTPHGLIHALAALIALISLAISMFTWSFVFKKNENWKSFAKPAMFFGVVSLVLFIVHFVSPIPLRGLTQRILLVWDISWLLLVSRKLYQYAAGVAASTYATQ